MRDLIEREGVEGFVIDSAGTGDWHVGKPADSRAIAAAADRGVTITSTARQVRPEDFSEFDLILAMDRANRDSLLAMEAADPGRVHLFRELAGEGELDVPDPYFGDDGGFGEVLDILERGSITVLDGLRN